MRILCIGDVIGKPGRRAVKELLPSLRDQHQIDLVFVNAENAAGGVGLTPDSAKELLDQNVDLLTGGNHIWKYKTIYSFLDSEKRIIRPFNYPLGAPGRGVTVVTAKNNIAVGVINLQGRTFMDPIRCPFVCAEEALEILRPKVSVILAEIHGEATSEKRALGWFLDGRVSAVYGTHTHVATADEEILTNGTGYITDIGMTGPYDSVIGMRKEDMIQRFMTMRPTPFIVAKKNTQLCGIIFDINPQTGKTTSIRRIQESLR